MTRTMKALGPFRAGDWGGIQKWREVGAEEKEKKKGDKAVRPRRLT